MSSALDRLAALAAGTAPVVSLRPSARFERPAATARVEGSAVVSPVPPREPPVAAADPAPVHRGHGGRRPVPPPPDPVVGEEVEAVVADPLRRTPAPVAGVAPVRAAAQNRPQSPAPEGVADVPARPISPAVRTARPGRRRSDPPPPPGDIEPPTPHVLLEEHIMPVLVREQVVSPSAVPGPSPRTDVEVVEILGEPRIERLRGEPPQVHVHIGEVRVSPPLAPAPAAPPAPAVPPTPAAPRPAPPDLDAYLAARREGRS